MAIMMWIQFFYICELGESILVNEKKNGKSAIFRLYILLLSLSEYLGQWICWNVILQRLASASDREPKSHRSFDQYATEFIRSQHWSVRSWSQPWSFQNCKLLIVQFNAQSQNQWQSINEICVNHIFQITNRIYSFVMFLMNFNQ